VFVYVLCAHYMGLKKLRTGEGGGAPAPSYHPNYALGLSPGP
jgi:hypothetical protein